MWHCTLLAFGLEVTHQSNTTRLHLDHCKTFDYKNRKGIRGHTMDAIYRWSYLQFEALVKMALVGQSLEYSLE